jgi:hypothetical protein
MDVLTRGRSYATRELLVEYVADHPARRSRGVVGVGLVLTGVLVGAGVSTGAFAATSLLSPGPEQPGGQANPDLGPPVAAPEGVIPGSALSLVIGDPTTLSYVGNASVSLADRPEKATHVRVTVTPEARAGKGGQLSFGTDSGGNNPGITWTESDVSRGTDLTTWYDFPLDADTSDLYVQGSESGLVSLQYLEQVQTSFGVNAAGQSFGITGSAQGEPDLIAVVATNGKEGYVFREDLEDADGTTDAANGVQTHGSPQTLPVYESDGTTQVGEFKLSF